jgi:hypothetical protein
MGEYIKTIGFMFKKSNVKIKCYKTGCYRYKLAQFKLTRNDFCSSTLEITTSPEEAWNSFKSNIYTLINSDFMISVTKCNKLSSFGAKLVKVRKCSCCDDVIGLYFSFNIVPLTPTPCNYSNSICIPLTVNSNVPNVSCTPNNYWPDPDGPNTLQTPANTAGNFFYNLECGTYSDIKFFYQENYCGTPCFKQQIVC